MGLEEKLNFRDKKVLITGGMGFIGSNLAIKLVEYGADVTIVDAMIPDYGGNEFNINPIKGMVKVNYNNILDKEVMNLLIKNKDLVFHLAGQVSHVLSFSDPRLDCEYNLTGTAVLLDACAKFNKDAVIIYTGTRGEYGKGIKLPASENHPLNPLDVHEVTKLAAGFLLQAYEKKYGIKYIWTRLTNIYGPRAQMKSDKYGIINWFIKKAIDNEEIPVFGDGKMLRDYLYVEDCVDALLKLAINKDTTGEIFNIGHDNPISTKDAVKKIIDICGSGKLVFKDYSAERKNQEVLHWYTDYNKLNRMIGWYPKISFDDGIKKTIDYYKSFKRFYW